MRCKWFRRAGGEPANAGYGYLWWTKPIRDGSPAYFAAGWQSQLILNLPDRNLVMALASASSLPGGAAKFVNEVCVTRRGGAAGGNSVCRAPGSVTGGCSAQDRAVGGMLQLAHFRHAAMSELSLVPRL